MKTCRDVLAAFALAAAAGGVLAQQCPLGSTWSLLDGRCVSPDRAPPAPSDAPAPAVLCDSGGTSGQCGAPDARPPAETGGTAQPIPAANADSPSPAAPAAASTS